VVADTSQKVKTYWLSSLNKGTAAQSSKSNINDIQANYEDSYALGCGDGSIIVLAAPDLEEKALLRSNRSCCLTLSWSTGDNDILASGHQSGWICVWDASAKHIITECQIS